MNIIWANKFQDVCQQLNSAMLPARVAFEHGDPPLHQAAYAGDIEKVKLLLQDSEHIKLINLKNRLGCTPIRLAATAGHSDCLKELLASGADVNVADVKAQTPLFVAVKNRHLACVSTLLAAGAGPDGDPLSLCTPLYVAAMDGFIEGLQMLISSGADLNLPQRSMDAFTSTPLYIALTYHHLNCFKLLLLSGADPNPVRYSPSQLSLYHVAVKHSADVIYVQLLYDFGTHLYIRNGGRLAIDLNHDNECRSYLKEIIGQVRTLMSSCRLLIRRNMGVHRLDQLHTLPIPKTLIRFLNHQT